MGPTTPKLMKEIEITPITIPESLCTSNKAIVDIRLRPGTQLTVSTGWLKNGLYLRVDKFAMVGGRKARDMSKVSEFCLEKVQNFHVDAFKYSFVIATTDDDNIVVVLKSTN